MSIFYIQEHLTFLKPELCGSTQRLLSPLPKPSTISFADTTLDSIYFHHLLANLLFPYSSTVWSNPKDL